MSSRGSLSLVPPSQVPASSPPLLGWWQPGEEPPEQGEEALARALDELSVPRFALRLADGSTAWTRTDRGSLRPEAEQADGLPVLGLMPAILPSQLGDPEFRRAHGLRYNYVAGAMANGIASVEMVSAVARAGMLGFFGAAGLPPAEVEKAIERLGRELGSLPWGVNLIHAPFEGDIEDRVVELLLQHGVRCIEASAYMELSLPLVRYRLHGIGRADDGSVRLPNRVVAKVSRVEVAERFLTPAPEPLVRALLASGELSPEQAELAARVPMADDLTVEADSAGHTDNRPAIALLPTLLALRDRLQAQQGFFPSVRVGLGGGISTPAAAAAAFALGAGYLVTGSVNQACVESGSSDAVRRMLAEAEQADVIMAPAADMFEMGVQVQVLKRGTMFPMRAQKLYELYRRHGSLGEIPAKERSLLEKTIFRETLDEVWRQTRSFFAQRDPKQLTRAETDEKHRMALVFRWYLGQSSRWANAGQADRALDYQVWCGPAMGAFNEWTEGTFLADPAERRVAVVAGNLLAGAARISRAQALRAQGIEVPSRLISTPPRPAEQLAEVVP